MSEPTLVDASPAEHQQSGDDLLTIPEAAEILKVSTVTLSRWRRQGRLPTLKIGPRAVRIRRADLELVARRYSGPVTSLDLPGALVVEVASTAPPAPDPAAGAVPMERTLARATQLRTMILTRRNGEFLEPAGDDLGRLREKRARRRA